MQKTTKKPKFNFEELKAGATSPNRAMRKTVFEDYFERFQEFPSYLFDNTDKIDSRLYETIQDLKNDPATPQTVLKGIEALLMRLPAMKES